MTDSQFSRPCTNCVEGRHEQCGTAICGCLANHDGDEPMIRGFKRLKRLLHPERESWVKGGWTPTAVATPPVQRSHWCGNTDRHAPHPRPVPTCNGFGIGSDGGL